MAKYSMKKGGKEVGSASVYAEPHTMSGKEMTSAESSVVKKGNAMDELKISVAGISKSRNTEVKTTGVETRGNGCATKGRIARGPMA